jgi:hypothetical protein
VDCRIIISFIGGFVSLGRFISDIILIGIVSLIGSSASSAHWLIGFGGFTIRSVAAIIAATANLSAVVRKQATRGVAAFFAALHPCNHLAVAGATATRWLKHTASHRVAALRISASKNCKCGNCALCHLITSHSFVCEGDDYLLAACSREEKYVVVDCFFWQFL